MSSPPIITAEHLSRSFGDLQAVRNLNLSIPRGVLYGLVGPDGAGKTTTIRLLTGILSPSDGDAHVAGLSVRDDPEGIKARIGYMSQRFGLYEDLTVLENIHFYADLYEVPARPRAERIDRLLGFSRLSPYRDRLAGALSGGMKQKLGLACALVHTPELLLLDEPTNGVDPVSRRDFWRILYDLLREQVSIFLSTSYLDEAERCGMVGLLYEGRLIREDQPQNIRRSYPFPVREIWCDDVRRAGTLLRGTEGIASVSVYGDRLHVTGRTAGALDAALERLRAERLLVLDHRTITPSLEDVFISLVERTMPAAGKGGN
jgi:ABC-2 type transport system ATP-binding protein